MLEYEKIMSPPWIAFSELEKNCIHGENKVFKEYTEKWFSMYEQLSKTEQREYLQLFPEPLPWWGFITKTDKCKSVQIGDYSVKLWTKDGTPKYSRYNIVNDLTDRSAEMYVFWGHHPAKNGRISKSCFSQWWMSDFRFMDKLFCCMEQCMMYGKAKLFNDTISMDQIMNCYDPKMIKALGRKVHNFEESAWNAVKYSLVLNGNYNKFTQNAELRNFLISTGNSILVEASPYDQIWGVGLSAEDPRIKDPRQWKGENLLGFALMEVRDEIRRVYENEKLCSNLWR